MAAGLWKDLMRSGKLYWADTLLKSPVPPVARTQQFSSYQTHMPRLFLRLATCAGLLAPLVLPVVARSQGAVSAPAFAMVIHGGAGTILRQNMTPVMERAYIDTLTIALRTGYQILARGGSSLDAVEATIKVMEDSPIFNAGKGAVFTANGVNELDEHGGGGVIVMDVKGNVATSFNTPGMYRGWVTSDGKITVKIYKD